MVRKIINLKDIMDLTARGTVVKVYSNDRGKWICSVQPEEFWKFEYSIYSTCQVLSIESEDDAIKVYVTTK